MSTCMLKGDGRRRGQLLLEGLTLWGIGWQGLDVVDRTLIHDRLEVLIRGTFEDPHDLLELISWVRPFEQGTSQVELGEDAAD
jgi:hypothetical protein